MNVYEKLLKARDIISKTKIKKEGRNEYSKYDYFTPSQVSSLVTHACQETKLLTTFSMKKDEFGYRGVLNVIDVETPKEHISFDLVTDVPDITATNMSQKLGGMATFTERYLKMSVFEIVDNNLDFDSQDNRSKPKRKLEEKVEDKPKENKEKTPKEYVDIMIDTIGKATSIQSLDVMKKSIDERFEKTEGFTKAQKDKVNKVYTDKRLEISKSK